MSVKKHDLEAVRLLLEYGANPNIQGGCGRTPLHIAFAEKDGKSDTHQFVEVIDNEEEIIFCLLEAGADYDDRAKSNGKSRLYEACRLGLERRAEAFLERGADPNVMWEITENDRKESKKPENEEFGTAVDGGNESKKVRKESVLGIAVKKERSARLIEKLLACGANPNVQNHLGYTPLHTAVNMKNVALVKLLLEKGKADPNIPSNNGVSPLHTAFCVALTENVIRNKRTSNTSTLEKADRQKDVEEIILLLVKHGANKNVTHSSGSTLLKTALCGENPMLLLALLQRSNGEIVTADLDSFSVRPGSTLLHSLVCMKYYSGADLEFYQESLKQFITRAALDANIRNANGYTPIHSLVLSVVKRMHELESEANSMDTHHCAIQLIKLLLSVGADINMPHPTSGYTPFHSAGWYSPIFLRLTIILSPYFFLF